MADAQAAAPMIRPQFQLKTVPKKDRTPRLVRRLVKMSERKDKDLPWEDAVVEDDRPQYDVFFPAGHSIRVIGEKSLKQLGLAGTPGLIDMNSGEMVPQPDPVDLEAHVERTTQRSRQGVAA